MNVVSQFCLMLMEGTINLSMENDRRYLVKSKISATANFEVRNS